MSEVVVELQMGERLITKLLLLIRLIEHDTVSGLLDHKTIRVKNELRLLLAKAGVDVD